MTFKHETLFQHEFCVVLEAVFNLLETRADQVRGRVNDFHLRPVAYDIPHVIREACDHHLSFFWVGCGKGQLQAWHSEIQKGIKRSPPRNMTARNRRVCVRYFLTGCVHKIQFFSQFLDSKRFVILGNYGLFKSDVQSFDSHAGAVQLAESAQHEEKFDQQNQNQNANDNWRISGCFDGRSDADLRDLAPTVWLVSQSASG
mgnify:FL=1